MKVEPVIAPKSIALSYEGEDPEPHPDADDRSHQVSATEEQAGRLRDKTFELLSADFKVRFRAAHTARSRTAHGLKLWSKGVDQSSLWSSVLVYRVRFQLSDPKGNVLIAGVSEGSVFGPAGPNPRIDRDVKTSSILKLCGRDVSERVRNHFKPEKTTNLNPELTLWLRLEFDPSTGYPCQAEPPYYVDLNGLRYDINRNFIGEVEQAGQTLFVMSDRKRPDRSKGKPNK